MALNLPDKALQEALLRLSRCPISTCCVQDGYVEEPSALGRQPPSLQQES